jgi:hypothetical protein
VHVAAPGDPAPEPLCPKAGERVALNDDMRFLFARGANKRGFVTLINQVFAQPAGVPKW